MTTFTDKARAATAAMRDVFPATPLQRNDHLSALHGAEIWLKREDLSPVRSYKIRGALNAMRKVLADKPDQDTFVCASAGNHAQGVAYVCSHFGVKGVIFMPITTPDQKIHKTKVFGRDNIEIRLVGDYFDETLAAAQEYCAEVGGHFLAPFDDADVIEGQASIGVEVLDSMTSAPDIVVLPVGGGGLGAGLVQYFKENAPETRLVFVEPTGGASLAASIEAGQLTTLDHVDTFVDGAAVARIGEQNYQVLKGTCAGDIVSVSEDQICTTILDMLNTEGVVLEPAGAMSIEALKEIGDIEGKRVLCISSGGNFDFERLPEVKERAQRYSGVKKYFVLRMPQRPGALKEFLGMLGPNDDIARFEYLKKSARNFGSVLIGIETVEPDNFKILVRKLEEAGFGYRDITDDDTLSELIV